LFFKVVNALNFKKIPLASADRRGERAKGGEKLVTQGCFGNQVTLSNLILGVTLPRDRWVPGEMMDII